jgi:hypothetical protein
MIIVTGMHRSGTSCITGLLEKCGLSLGTNYPLLNEPRFDNRKGHFENRGAIALNETILQTAGGTWCNPPSAEAVELAGKKLGSYITRFAETFNGDLFKDPRTCLTMPVWRKYCPDISAVVFCVRHPIAVAGSLKSRNNIPVGQGLILWYEYNLRCIEALQDLPCFIVDYDNLNRNFEFEIYNLCRHLGLKLDLVELRSRTLGFFSGDLNHNDVSSAGIDGLLPPDIRSLYEILMSQTFKNRESDCSFSLAAVA